VAYSLAAAYPDAVRAAVSIGICHPKALFNMLTMPEQIQNFFQLWFFQLVGIAEFAVSANDYAFIDYFWRFRSSGYVDPEHLVCVKRTLDAPGSLEAALGYYRAGFDRARQDATLVHVAEAINQVTPVPMHAVFGDRDIKRHLAATQHELFAGPYRLSVVEGCGHFVHRERPEVLTRLILDWFATHGGTGR
jgi:pimeloyl-ACP methyl ester carboxylesterase